MWKISRLNQTTYVHNMLGKLSTLWARITGGGCRFELDFLSQRSRKRNGHALACCDFPLSWNMTVDLRHRVIRTSSSVLRILYEDRHCITSHLITPSEINPISPSPSQASLAPYACFRIALIHSSTRPDTPDCGWTDFSYRQLWRHIHFGISSREGGRSYAGIDRIMGLVNVDWHRGHGNLPVLGVA